MPRFLSVPTCAGPADRCGDGWRRCVRIATTIGLLAGLLGAGRASAELIAVDDFETYAPGNLAGNNGGGGQWTGAYAANTAIKVVAGGLSYSSGPIVINGGSQNASLNYINGTVDSVLTRPFAAQTDTLYFSFLFRPINGVTVGEDDFIQFIMNDDTDHDNGASIGMRQQFFTRIRNTGDATNNSMTTVLEDETYLLVGKVSKNASTNYNRMQLFINPSMLTEPGTADATTNSNSGATEYDYFTMRTAFLESLDRYDFDVLRIGTTFGDVVAPYNVAAIPEPSSLALVGGALLVPAYRRWRRRRSAS